MHVDKCNGNLSSCKWRKALFATNVHEISRERKIRKYQYKVHSWEPIVCQMQYLSCVVRADSFVIDCRELILEAYVVMLALALVTFPKD